MSGYRPPIPEGIDPELHPLTAEYFELANYGGRSDAAETRLGDIELTWAEQVPALLMLLLRTKRFLSDPGNTDPQAATTVDALRADIETMFRDFPK